MTVTATIPAEIVRPGKAVQRVNVFNDGAFERQVCQYGTEDQVRAYITALATHQ